MLPAEGFQPTLSKLVDVLNRFGIRFHLTGEMKLVALLDEVLAESDEIDA